MIKKTILVTGGAGFIGSNIVKLLCDDGHSVRIVDDLSFGFEKFVDNRAKFYKASIANDKVLDEALVGVDTVFHLAASSIIKYSIENPMSYIENNVLNGVKLLESMRRAGVKKIIFSSSASVYGEPEEIPIKESHPKKPMQPYGATKLSFENILQAYYHSFGVESTSLRYFNAYGPSDEQQPVTRAVPTWIKQILNGEPPTVYWSGNQLRDYVFVKDIAQAHLAVAELDGWNVFNIGSGTGILMRDLLQEIFLILGMETKIIDRGERPGDPERLVADISAIYKAVNWRPEVSLHDGMLETVRYYKENFQK
ncbi:MAG: NAD-dependent epimerase/dehydratase family protein [Candidatus Vogelbacteria bacterium]|nr:NAD-dependent epimerase/dehydratase family protein [Candidatus Vogelbacteria bacterium]